MYLITVMKRELEQALSWATNQGESLTQMNVGELAIGEEGDNSSKRKMAIRFECANEEIKWSQNGE